MLTSLPSGLVPSQPGVDVSSLAPGSLEQLIAQGYVVSGNRVYTPQQAQSMGLTPGLTPIDPVAASLADGSIDLAAYQAAMGVGGSVGGPPPGTPANSIPPNTNDPFKPGYAPAQQPADVPLGGPGTPGYTGNSPEPDPGPPGFRDTDGNGIDDREQTTVGQTSFGLPYGQMQGMPTLPTGWGSAVNTGMGGFVPADGGGGGSLGGYGSDLGGYPGVSTGGTGGPASGGNFTLPGGGTAPFTPGTPPTSNLPDVSQIGAGVTGGGSAGGVMGWPDFQNPLGGGTGTGTGTGTTGTGSTGTGTGGTPSGGSGLVQNLAGSYQGAINSANAANENRFATGLELLLKRAEQAGSAIQGLTYEGMNDIGRMFGQQRDRADQDLINRGLANTTVREGIMRGYATDEQAARNRYADDQTRKNIDENYRQQQGMVDWLGARNDVGPDVGQLANLASGVGAAGPGATTGTQTTGSMAPAQQQNLPAPVGNVVSNPASTTGQRLDVSMDANGNITQSVGGQPLSGPVSSGNSNALTRASTAGGPPPSASTGSSSLGGYGDAMLSAMTSAMSLRNNQPPPTPAANTGSSSIGGVTTVNGKPTIAPRPVNGPSDLPPPPPGNWWEDSAAYRNDVASGRYSGQPGSLNYTGGATPPAAPGVDSPSSVTQSPSTGTAKTASAEPDVMRFAQPPASLGNVELPQGHRVGMSSGLPAGPQGDPNRNLQVSAQEARNKGFDKAPFGGIDASAFRNPDFGTASQPQTRSASEFNWARPESVAEFRQQPPTSGASQGGSTPSLSTYGLPSGGAMLRNDQIDQNTNDNPDLLGFGANGVAQRGVAGTLQTGPMNAPPPGMAGMTSSTGGTPAYQPPPGMANPMQQRANDMVSQLQAMNTGAPPAMPTDRPSGPYMPFGKPMGGDFGYADPAKFATPPVSTGSQTMLGVMGNYGSSPSGATPPAPPPAQQPGSLTGAPARALVDNFQASPPPGAQTQPSGESRYNLLPLNTPMYQAPGGQMPPQFMQNGQMTPAQFLPTLSRYGVLA
mgnify:FL=1